MQALRRCACADVDDVHGEEHARNEVDHAAIHGFLNVRLHVRRRGRGGRPLRFAPSTPRQLARVAAWHQSARSPRAGCSWLARSWTGRRSRAHAWNRGRRVRRRRAAGCARKGAGRAHPTLESRTACAESRRSCAPACLESRTACAASSRSCAPVTVRGPSERVPGRRQPFRPRR